MKTGIVNGLMCLIGLHSPNLCMAEPNWKNRKNTHFKTTMDRGNFLRTTQDLNYFSQQLSNEKDFMDHLDTILVPRPVGSPAHKDVQRYITSKMEGFGWEVETPSFKSRTPVGERTFTNVVATLDPRAPRRLVIACHYDSLLNPEGFLGATDSAVPCSMMLNMAKVMRQDLMEHKSKGNELTLQFIFFDGEEAFVSWTSSDSIYGSKNLAETWEGKGFNHDGVNGNHNDRIDLFLLLDLIGAKGMQFSKLETTTGDWYNRLVDIERNLRNTQIISKGSVMLKDQFLRAGIEDDHIPFKRRGVPILHLIAYPFPKAWHKMGDDKRSLDFTLIENLNMILRVFVAEYIDIP